MVGVTDRWVWPCYIFFSLTVQELDAMVCEWGDMQHHAPILLAWTVLKSVVHSDKNEEVRMCVRACVHMCVRARVLCLLCE